MVRVGYITEHPTKPKKIFFGKYTEDIFLNPRNPFEIARVTVPFSATQLERMSEKRMRKVLDKARLTVEKTGIHCFLSPVLKCISNVSTDEELYTNKKRIFEKWAYKGVRELTEKCGIQLLYSNICISDTNAERISENLLKNLCYDTKSLCLCTKNLSRAERICDEILDDTGMLVRLSDIRATKSADVLIDVDNSLLRIGRNLVVDGVAGDFELNGFPIDPVEITAAIGMLEEPVGKLYYFFGKKKLTL